MLKRIERLLRRECGIEPGAVIIAGVSGGPDSLCLLHALLALGHCPIVAHLDHQLRPESTAEVARVAEFAAALGLPFVTARQDVAAHASTNRMSIEDAGRNLRYTFLLAQARAHAAAAVAVGHTADDQAETILMHLLRGAGIAGLSGMAPRVTLSEFDATIPVVRPLLGIWRRQTLDYCRLHGLPAVVDSSNESREFLRNRVRLDLIPILETYNPQIREAVVRLSHSATGDLALVEQLVSLAWQRTLMNRTPEYVAFDAANLGSELPAVQRRLVMRAATQLQPGTELDFEDLQRAECFISDRSSRRLHLGDGLTLYRESHTVFVVLGEQMLPSDEYPQLPGASIPIKAGGTVIVPLAGNWQFTLQLVADFQAGHESPTPDPYRGVLDVDMLPPELELRVPRAGDRIQPLGLQGHTQKLSDVFINIRVPERLRPRWPVLASRDAVVWIPGFRIAEPYRIRKETHRAAVVVVRRSG